MAVLTLNLLDCITDTQHIKDIAYLEYIVKNLTREEYEEINKQCEILLTTLKGLREE